MTNAIAFLVSDVGGGHRSVAAAVSEGVAERVPGIRCVMLDLFRQCFPGPLGEADRLYGPLIRQAPGLWHLAWRISRGRRRSEALRRAVRPFLAARLARVLSDHRPSAVVAVQPLAHDPAAEVAKGLSHPPRVITLISDPIDVHPLWIRPGADLYLVGSERARAQAVDWGAPADRVREVGLPVRRAFWEKPQRSRELRQDPGLEQEPFAVLVVGGAEGVGDLLELVRTLADSGLPLQMVVVAGRNEGMRRRLERQGWSLSVRVLGFTDGMASLMHGADCVLTKAGPTTLAEALASGTPIVVTGHIPGQEAANVGWVRDAGAALHAPTPEAAREAVAQLLRDEGLRRNMVRAGRALARPDAAAKAADAILETIE